MAFAQQSGPPASRSQLQQLLALVQAAGHADFRDARGAMHFTQRQAAGKFTRDEAEQLIAQLENEDGEESPTVGAAPVRPSPRVLAEEQLLTKLPAARLAAELQRRGWIVVEP